ncbi:MAB_1171c family putative transporter [Rhodococcus opacus]|uniref:MAB_1171c family putative transporter n=1 Tax=Rhodococcus TaxID=1827 RepID=UPI00142394C4|nr:MAB_1171c family putative transporter [Rhodococcus opacus]NHU47241.1 hypothetical protein [Rhodococcus sp. A14]MBA8959327.1 hypothetical protein [Rhodococcus opacus]MBP2204892.1 hypothetical protein [Rhodococcus opacus]MDJ0416411.1 hypothetical protein [Rhodococcus opacus]UNN03410.1 hypothetical protein MOO23_13730 [Rhodococcus opacus]
MYTPPGLVSWSLLALIWGTTALRLVFVRSTVAEQRINAALVFASLSVALRRQWVRDIVDGVFGAGISSPLGNACIIFTAASLISLFSVWAFGPDRFRRIHAVTLAVAVLPAAALIVLSGPARAQGVGVKAAGGWQYTAFCIAYALPILLAALLIAGISIRSVRAAASGRDRWVFAAVIALSVFEVVSMVVVMIDGVMRTSAADDAVTESHAEAGVFLRLLVVAAGAVIALGPVLRVLLRRYRSGRTARRLLPVWRTLTAAVPEVVFELRPEDRRALSARARRDRMEVEIRDAILVVDRYLPGDVGDPAASPVRAAATRLHLACLARAAGHPPVTGLYSGSSQPGGEPWELARLADHWRDAEHVAAELWARRLPQFGGPADPSARVPAQV